MPSQFSSATERMTPPLLYPQRYNLDGSLKDIAPRQILHASDAISVYGGGSPGEPRTRALRPGAECYAERATT